jgi:hypothetical protein
VEHPYREPIPAAQVGSPSQAGASIEGRPRTAGSFQFKTRSIPTEPEPLVIVPDPEPQTLLSRLPVKPVSVQARKNLFESKISQNRSAPHTEPSRAVAVVKGISTKETSQVKQASLQSHDEPTRTTSLTAPHAPKRTNSDPALPIPCPPPQADTRLVPSQRTNPFSRPKIEPSRPKVGVTKPTERQDLPIFEDSLPTPDPDSNESARTVQRSSVDVSDSPPLGVNPQATEDSSGVDEASKAPLVPDIKASKPNSRRTSEETVSHRTTCEPMSLVETGEVRTSDSQDYTQRAPRSELGGDIRRVVVEDKGPSVRDKNGHRSPQDASLTDIVAPNNSSEPTTKQKDTTSTISRDSVGKHIGVRKRVEYFTARRMR